MKPRILSSSTLTGTNVENFHGNKLGGIYDVMIDLETGEVVYAVLSHGGFLGIGTDYFAVPVQAFKCSEKDDKAIKLDVDDEVLDNAPGFDKNNWPSASSSVFTETVYEHYGYKRNTY